VFNFWYWAWRVVVAMVGYFEEQETFEEDLVNSSYISTISIWGLRALCKRHETLATQSLPFC